MSVYAYTGLPGAGKSYIVVEHQIIPALKAGRRVVTNLRMKWDLARKDFPEGELVELPSDAVQANPATLLEYVTPGSVLVLDEVWRLFPAGLKSNHVPEPYRKLLAEHRHMVNSKGESAQIVLVTHDLAQISAFARQLVEHTFHAVKLSSMGLSGQYRVDVFNGPISGANPPLQSRLRELYGRYKVDVWQYYESHTMREGEGSGANESAIDKRANFLRSPVFVIAAVLAVIIGWWAFPRIANLSSGDGGLFGGASTAAVLPTARPEAAAVAVPAGYASSPAAMPSALPAWRIAAYIQAADVSASLRSLAVITDGQRNVTLVWGEACREPPQGRPYCVWEGQRVYLEERWPESGAAGTENSGFNPSPN